MSLRSLALSMLLVGSLLPIAAVSVSATTGPDTNGAELMRLTNLDRVALGKPALAVDPLLASLAANRPFTCPSNSALVVQGRAQDMASRGYFAHEIAGCAKGAGFYTVMDIMSAPFGYNTSRGENLAVNNYPATAAAYTVGCDALGANCGSTTPSTATVGAAERELMMSPWHRDNVLGAYDRFGCGSASAADGDVYYACLFSLGGPAAAPAPDTTPPRVTSVTGRNASFSRYAGRTFAATLSDNQRITSAYVTMDGIRIHTWPLTSTSRRVSVWAPSSRMRHGYHTIEWRVRDAAGNWSTVSSGTVRFYVR